MNENGRRFYHTFLQAPEHIDDPDLLHDLHRETFTYFLYHPDLARTFIPPLTESLKRYMRTRETSVHQSTKDAWEVLTQATRPYQQQIDGWNAIAIVFGSVAYDSASHKDLDMEIYTATNVMPTQVAIRLHNGLEEPVETKNLSLDLSIRSIQSWNEEIQTPNVLSDPIAAEHAYTSTIFVAPLLYGLLLTGRQSVQQTLEQQVQTVIRKEPIAASLMAYHLAFTLTRVQERLG